jgi:hypothetical protein
VFEVGRVQKPKPLNVEMHIYGTGGHGGSIFASKKPHPFSRWPERFVEWVTDLGHAAGGEVTMTGASRVSFFSPIRRKRRACEPSRTEVTPALREAARTSS